MIYLESDEAVLCPIPGSIQGKAVWGPRQLDLVRGNLVHSMEVGNRWSLRPFPTKILLWFNDSMTEKNNEKMWHQCKIRQMHICQQSGLSQGYQVQLLNAFPSKLLSCYTFNLPSHISTCSTSEYNSALTIHIKDQDCGNFMIILICLSFLENVP